LFAKLQAYGASGNARRRSYRGTTVNVLSLSSELDCVTLCTLGGAGAVCRWQRAGLWLDEEHNQQCITETV